MAPSAISDLIHAPASPISTCTLFQKVQAPMSINHNFTSKTSQLLCKVLHTLLHFKASPSLLPAPPQASASTSQPWGGVCQLTAHPHTSVSILRTQPSARLDSTTAVCATDGEHPEQKSQGQVYISQLKLWRCRTTSSLCCQESPLEGLQASGSPRCSHPSLSPVSSWHSSTAQPSVLSPWAVAVPCTQAWPLRAQVQPCGTAATRT